MEPPSSDDPDSPHPDDEGALIASLLQARPPLRRRPKLDLGDDAAITAQGTVLTTDTLVAGVHFDTRTPPREVAYKTLAVSVSDLAACGAAADWALLSIACPDARSPWMAEFTLGFGSALGVFAVDLLGGDTVRSPGPVTLTLTLGGHTVGAPLTRSGARRGDSLWVTGIPGLAGAGWQNAAPHADAIRALHHPEPPVAFALALARNKLASAAMDLSDGLGADLPRLAAASKVAIVLDEASLPSHPALTNARLHRFAGGDDYELLFCAPPQSTRAIHALATSYNVVVSCIGRIEAGCGARLRDGAWPDLAFRHFDASAAP